MKLKSFIYTILHPKRKTATPFFFGFCLILSNWVRKKSRFLLVEWKAGSSGRCRCTTVTVMDGNTSECPSSCLQLPAVWPRCSLINTNTSSLSQCVSPYHLIIDGTYSWHKSFSFGLYLTLKNEEKKNLCDLIWILHCCNHAKSASRTRRTASLFWAHSVMACAEMGLLFG